MRIVSRGGCIRLSVCGGEPARGLVLRRYAMPVRGGAVASYGFPSPHAAHGVRRGTGTSNSCVPTVLLAGRSASSEGRFAPPPVPAVGLRSDSTLRAGEATDGAAG